MLTTEQALKLKIRPVNFEKYRIGLEMAAERESLQHPLQQAHFLTQILHESGNMRTTVENLNYSSGGLQRVFKKYFPNKEIAKEYARDPKRIANLVYGKRLGNRGVDSGDGWRYRGRGLIQLTGRNNYKRFYDWYIEHVNSDTDFDWLVERTVTDFAVDAAVYFWEKKELDRLAMEDDINRITFKVNGSTHSVPERTELLNRVKSVVDFSEVTG